MLYLQITLKISLLWESALGLFTRAVESVAEMPANTGTGKVSRCVGTVSVWTATSVIHSTLIHICVTTHLMH